MKRLSNLHFRALLLSLLFGVPALHAQETIYFKNGETVEAEIVSVNANQVSWRIYPTGGAITQTPVNLLEWIDFRPTEEWSVAEATLSRGEFLEAGRLFSAIAVNRQGNYYPVPGNFATRALRRIMDCHRLLLNAKQVSVNGRRLAKELNTLPPRERTFSPVEQAWVAAGEDQWEKVVTIVSSAKTSGSDTVEISYLAGRAHQSLGNQEAALDAYTIAYSFGFGSHPEIARNSLRSSAEILSTLGDEDRVAELQSQLKIYQELFGKGQLWEGAPDAMIELAKADLDTFDFAAAVEKEAPVLTAVPPDLEPLKDRPWIHALETDQRIYAVGLGAFETKESGNPERSGGDYLFNGESFMWKSKVKINTNHMRCRIMFVPETKNGFIFTAGEGEVGLAIYIKEGQLYLAWHDKKDRRTELALGPIQVGTEHILNFMITGTREIKGRLSPGAYQTFGTVPGFISAANPVTLALAPNADRDTVTDHELPRFKGRIRHFSIGFTKDGNEFKEAELKMFGGKQLRFGPPPSPDAASAQKPQSQSDPAPAGGRIKARFVRISMGGKPRGGLKLSEVEVYSGESNIASSGTAKISRPEKGQSAAHAIDGDTKPPKIAGAKGRTPNPSWELDLGKMVEIDSVTVWTARSGGKVDKTLNGSNLALLDESRKPVFTAKIKVAQDPKLEFLIK